MQRLLHLNWALVLAWFVPIALAVGCGGTSPSLRENPLPEVCGPDEPPTPTSPSFRHTPHVIRGGIVMTAAGDIHDPGYVVIQEGRITDVGPGEPANLPDGAEVLDASGRYVTPGLIDTHSHLGVYPTPYVPAHSDGNEATSPITAHVEAIDSIWPQDPGFMRAVAGGVTTLQVLPGSANLIGGRGVTLKLHRGARMPEDMRFDGAPEGLKMACGENPKMVYGNRGSSPSTRMASIAMMREAWIGAVEFLERSEEYAEDVVTWCEEGASEDEEPDEPGRDLGNETLAAVLEGDILVHIHCYRADEMLVQIALADEFGYEIRSFHHAVEAYKIRDVLAERGIGTSTWADWWGFKMEAFDAIPQNAALVANAGARAIIHSDSSIGIQRLNQEAAKALYSGLNAGLEISEDEALRWITANPAWALGVDAQTGSLEVGKMGDVVVWSGHPFSVYTEADIVFVDGLIEYDHSQDEEPWSDFELGLWPQTR